MLGLRIVGTTRHVLECCRQPYQYDVTGLPDEHEASIAKFDGCWQLLRIIEGQSGEWQGPFVTPEAALDHLQSDCGNNAPPAEERDIPNGDWVLRRALRTASAGRVLTFYSLVRHAPRARLVPRVGQSLDELRHELLTLSQGDKVDAWFLEGHLVRRLGRFRPRGKP